jgi:hypothetical protein
MGALGMKRPSFQFYPFDWTGNSNLRRCSHAAKGAWIDVMCLMHDQDEYGVLRWSLKEIAQATGCQVIHLKELSSKGVLKGDDRRLIEAFIYTPRSGRKNGEPVELLPAQDGPIWYSSRMVKDEHVRKHAGASTRFGADARGHDKPAPQPKAETERAKLRARILEKTAGDCYHCAAALGERWEIDHLMPRSKGGRHTFANMVASCVSCNQDKSDTLPDDWDALRPSPSRRHGEVEGANQGDGSTSPSSPTDKKNSVPDGTGAEAPPAEAPPDPLTPKEALFQVAVPWLVARGMRDPNARSLLGGAVKQLGEDEAWLLASECIRGDVLEPGAWISKALNERIAAGGTLSRGATSKPKAAERRADWNAEMAATIAAATSTSRREIDMGTIDATGNPV